MNGVPPSAGARSEAGLAVLTAAAILAFALNSLLCRAALGPGLIDASTFTLVRVATGAGILGAIVAFSRRSAIHLRPPLGALAPSALALLLYAWPFSLAYNLIPAGTGAFVLFGAVQVTMLGFDVAHGRGLTTQEFAGFLTAIIGLAWLTRPGSGSPDPRGVLLMLLAGLAWGVYSIRGRTSASPLEATAWNFVGATPILLLILAALRPAIHVTALGLLLAAASGGITSGLGYVAWYAVLPRLGATRASIVQLAVPPLAAVLGVGLLGEEVTSRLLVGAPLVVGGIAVAVLRKARG